MRNSLQVFAFVAVLLSGPTAALALTTMVDEAARRVRVEFTGLPPYEQIRLEGVTGLFSCFCNDPDNPSSLSFTEFTVPPGDLEMKYEGGAPSTNYIEYSYLEEYEFMGFESVDWVVVTEVGGDEIVMTGDRPVMRVPEPSPDLLSMVALAVAAGLAKGRRGVGRVWAPRPNVDTIRDREVSRST
jgi:hypothetical protein